MTQLVDIVVGWPIVASIAVAMTANWRAARRRGALNEALHELRRPLQSLVLVTGADGSPGVVGGSAELATQALDRLERQVNGGIAQPRRELVAVSRLAEAAVGRWRARASLAGGSLELRWLAGEALVAADGFELAQALDNLIVNAIEHGGPTVVVRATRQGETLRITVGDSGRLSRPPERRETPSEAIARLCGRRRRGHGLAVVRRIAARASGRFSLRCSERGSRAVLELPLTRAPGRPSR
jgi:K+-sensing histidine kinase KdpD